MGEQKIQWPRKSIARAIRKIGVGDITETESLGPEITDVTLKSGVGEQLIQSAPEIDLIGSEVVADSRSRIWGGALVRALDIKDEDSGLRKRCLEYIYTYTLQRGGVSVFWNLFMPLLTLAFAFISPTIFTYLVYPHIFTDLYLNIAFSVFLVFLPLWLLPMSQHLGDWVDQKKKQIHIRGTTGQLVFGILPGGLVIWFTLPGNLIGTIAIITFAFFYTVFFFEYLLCLFGKGITCHRMDFAPIFLYLKEVAEEKWIPESTCYDYYHYGAICNPLEKEKRLNLIMCDSWHSFSRKGFLNKSYTTLLGFLLMVGGAVVLIITTLVQSLHEYAAVLGLFVVVLGFLIITQRPLGGKNLSDLSVLSDAQYLSEKAHLTQEKLEILWNLKDSNARLKITATLQDPFNNHPSKSGSFNDVETRGSAPSIESVEPEEEVAERRVTKEIPEAPVSEPPPSKEEGAPPSDYDSTSRDPKRLRIDPSRRLGYRPEDEE